MIKEIKISLWLRRRRQSKKNAYIVSMFFRYCIGLGLFFYGYGGVLECSEKSLKGDRHIQEEHPTKIKKKSYIKGMGVGIFLALGSAVSLFGMGLLGALVWFLVGTFFTHDLEKGLIMPFHWILNGIVFCLSYSYIFLLVAFFGGLSGLLWVYMNRKSREKAMQSISPKT